MHLEFARHIPGGVSRLVPRPVKNVLLHGLACGKALVRHEHGVCCVCGHTTFFCYDQQNSEDVDCLFCLSASRNRAVALEVLDFAAQKSGGKSYRSLGELAAANALDIYLLAAHGSVARQLRRSPRVALSEFYDDVPPGETKDGIQCQDVRALTFPDARFDLVISECVFEHVPRYLDGFREVFRVLRPGGAHIFTIPYDPAIPTTDRFAEKDGQWVPILPLELHGDRIRGTIPAYTSFGHDLTAILADIGFETRIIDVPIDRARPYCIYDGRVFVSRKPATS